MRSQIRTPFLSTGDKKERTLGERNRLLENQIDRLERESENVLAGKYKTRPDGAAGGGAARGGREEQKLVHAVDQLAHLQRKVSQLENLVQEMANSKARLEQALAEQDQVGDGEQVGADLFPEQDRVGGGCGQPGRLLSLHTSRCIPECMKLRTWLLDTRRSRKDFHQHSLLYTMVYATLYT